MGIKGIYKEIGPGKRISLTKLAVQKLEESGQPLRIAIDISIWQFQAQAARGGSNPAIRTLFYRLLRLLGLSIVPIFVFDGPNKPAFKRNKRSSRGNGMATAMAKRLIRLFGFLAHDAPGEAEAECALLQQNGIVDAVLSEDVDTIMFGCTRTLRNWSAEGTKGSKAPTHVSMYDSRELSQGASGLDREGMVLVALMSGGDYIPEGIPGAGIKLACEAARGGFGKSLCQIKRSEASELASWKERLTYELRHNESGIFRTKHKALNIPDDFPNMEVLRYYTHPVVSPATVLDKLRQQNWQGRMDIQGLREFVRETFDWSYRIGAIKFIRVLAPCLLVRKLMQQHTTEPNDTSNNTNTTESGSELVGSITSRRAHFSTDATPELRISFIPTNIVGYDFQDEPDEVIEFGRDGLALNSDGEMEDEEAGDLDSTTKPGARKPFSPTDADLLWLPEQIARMGIPSMVEAWEDKQRAKTAARAKPKVSRQKAKAKAGGGMAAGALDKFTKVTKMDIGTSQNTEAKRVTRQSARTQVSSPPSPPSSSFIPPPTQTLTDILPASSQANAALLLSSSPPSQNQHQPATRPPSKPPTTPKPSRSSRSAGRKKLTAEVAVPSSINPWTITSSQGRSSSRVSKSTATSTAPFTSRPPPLSSTLSAKAPAPILIPSSPLSSSPMAAVAGLPSPVSPTATASIHNRHGLNPGGPFAATPTSPKRRRPLTPPGLTAGFTAGDEVCAPDSGRGVVGEQEHEHEQDSSRPVPAKAQRRLARTESLPVDVDASPRDYQMKRTGGLARAQTLTAVETVLLDSDSDLGSEDEEDEADLPPLNHLINRLPKPTNNIPDSPPPPRPHPQISNGRGTSTATGKKQITLEQTLESFTQTSTHTRTRTTKLYVPHKNQPGFFREIEVDVDDADAEAETLSQLRNSGSGTGGGEIGIGNGNERAARVWRRSDISFVDLTGED
ncbi:hypothetical protein F4777DRAFT_130909 [Nemania sp. FL0916]|nr:hypothetical protein F4777DRAFT_130909 [Nemania sp. FL0916]